MAALAGSVEIVWIDDKRLALCRAGNTKWAGPFREGGNRQPEAVPASCATVRFRASAEPDKVYIEARGPKCHVRL
jgi:hypothetical protein